MAEHAALVKFRYVDDAQRARLEGAQPSPQGEYATVHMEAYLAEMLVGDLAYVLNRARPTRTTALLHGAADAIELALR